MDLYMQIKGLTGPVTATRRTGWFKVTSLAWKIEARSFDQATGSKLPFVITRPVDAGSHATMEAMSRPFTLGGVDADTVIAGDTLVGGVPTPAVGYALLNAQVVSVRYSAVRGGADDVIEQATLQYGKLSVRHDQSKSGYQAV